jgi:hypothetical protein
MGHRASRHRRHRTTVLLGIWIGAIGIVIATVVAGCQGSAGERNARSIMLEPVNTAGASPFTPPVGTDQAGVTPPTNSGGTVAGNAVGLYGGARDRSSCDAGEMVTFLRAHPDKATAWAGIRGIGAGDIPAYVAALTPAILRSDTAITNHGFDGGHATTVPAVLQAGTAVLVDRYGFPVAKCLCGNPLTAPTVVERASVEQASYTGTSWPSFSAATVTVIQATTIMVNAFTLVEPATGVSFDRPTGTHGTQDKQLTGPPSSGPPSSGPPSSGPSEASNASWVAGSCLARSSVLYATVLVRNNGQAERHSYEVTVSFGPPESSYAQKTTSFEGMAPGQTREAGVTTESSARVPDGPVPCAITRIVDENGLRPAQGGTLPPPADRRPPPGTSKPPTTPKPPAVPPTRKPSPPEPPRTAPPTIQPPTVEPPTAEPPTAEPPPTGTSIEPDIPLPTN